MSDAFFCFHLEYKKKYTHTHSKGQKIEEVCSQYMREEKRKEKGD